MKNVLNNIEEIARDIVNYEYTSCLLDEEKNCKCKNIHINKDIKCFNAEKCLSLCRIRKQIII